MARTRCASVKDKPPMETIGHVTSTYMSPTLGRSIAMALIQNGRARMGETLSFPLEGGRVIKATVCRSGVLRQGRSAAEWLTPSTHRTPLAGRAGQRDSAVAIAEADRPRHDRPARPPRRSGVPKAAKTCSAWAAVETADLGRHGAVTALWLSLDQWLITCPRGEAAALAAALAAELTDVHALAVDVSDMRAILRVTGAGAAEVADEGHLRRSDA